MVFTIRTPATHALFPLRTLALLAVATLFLTATQAVAAPAADDLRVITLGPSITQTVAALGRSDAIVGRSQFLQDPPELLEKPSVGGINNPNLELVLSQKPDLLIALEFLPAQTTEILQQAGIRVEKVYFSSIDDIRTSTLKIGELLGPSTAERAAQLVSEWDATLAETAAATRDQPPQTVLMTFGIDPLFSPGEDSYLSALIQCAGGKNLADGGGSAWPQVNREAVLQRAPAVIIIVTSLAERNGIRQAVSTWSADPFWSALPAVRQNRVFWADSRVFSVPGPNIIPILQSLTAAIQNQESRQNTDHFEKLAPTADAPTPQADTQNHPD